MDQTSRYTVKGNQLIIEDVAIPFNFPIAQIIEMSDMFIVRLDKPIDVVYNENVFGVSVAEKKIRWQIEKRNYDPHMKSCPFIEIRIFEGQLRLNNWCSVYFIVDPLTGEILKDGWTR